MSKQIKIFILFMCIFILSSCNSKKEYTLIELTGEELISNIVSLDERKFIFAFVDRASNKYEQFMKDLASISKSTRNNIYYLESDFIDTNSSLILYNLDTFDFTNNSYYAFDGNEFIVKEIYVDLASMYSNLKNFGSKGIIEKIDDKGKEEYLKEASKLYDEGRIALSFNELNKAWDTLDAKEFYEKKEYFKMLSSWEYYEYKIIDDKDEVTCHSWIFYHGVNFYSVASVKGDYDTDFTDAFYEEDYTDVYYYVKDDIIYTSNKEDGKYTKTYEIIELSNKSMKLKEIKTKKEITLERYV